MTEVRQIAVTGSQTRPIFIRPVALNEIHIC